jgi:hypothetical protein
MYDSLMARVKAEVARIRYADQGQDPLLSASEELEALKLATAQATDEILSIGEAVIANVARLRRLDLPPVAENILAAMECQAGRLFEACGFQDLTGQRSSKVARVLEGLDLRVGTVLDMLDHVEVPDEIAREMQGVDASDPVTADAALLNGPQAAGEGLGQQDIDALFR